MKHIDIAIRKICKVFNNLGGVVLASLVILIVINIIGRFIKRPIMGSYEAVQYGFALIVCFAVAYTAVKEKHIDIALVYDKYPQKLKTAIDIISQLLGICIFMIITWRLSADGIEGYVVGETSSTLGLPVFIFQFALALGFALLSLVLIMNLWKRLVVSKCHL